MGFGAPAAAPAPAAAARGSVRGLPEPALETEPDAPAALPVDEPVRRGDPDPGGEVAPPAVPTRVGGLTSDSLTADTVLRSRQPRPRGGWRRFVYSASGGTINPGPSAREVALATLEERARTPVRGCQRVAVLSLKGGVGKTTTSAALGATFAVLRGDRVIALDANPDRGTLGEKVPRENERTVRDLIDARARLHRYADVRAYTSQAPSRLEVLASDSDPGISQAFSEADYRTALDVLEVFYSLVITDCGTGLLHSAMRGVLGLADQIVLVSSGSLDGARSASATLDWLEAHGHGDLAARAVTVISAVRPGRSDVDVDRLEEHFATRCRAVERVPYDAHLASGGIVDLDALAPGTRAAYLRVAALVGEEFGRTRT